LFFENRAVYVIMWKKYCTAGEDTDDKMAHALWMLENKGYRNTLRISNIYCFSTSISVTRKRLDDALYGVVPLPVLLRSHFIVLCLWSSRIVTDPPHRWR